MDTRRSDLTSAQARIGETESAASDARQRLHCKRNEAAAARAQCTELRARRDKATDERKGLWHKEQELAVARRTASEELDKARRTLQQSMSRQQWEAICAVRSIATKRGLSGLYGLVRLATQ